MDWLSRLPAGRRSGWLYLALATLWVSSFLALAQDWGELGFPLDDAWIHQTYARNLARTGRWDYVPGQASAGSTAPLWTGLLAVGYKLGLPYQAWTWGWGILLLAAAGWLARRLAGRLAPGRGRLGFWVGLFVVSEWHLIWAAASGMETILYVVLVLALLDRTDAAVAGEDDLALGRLRVKRGSWLLVGLLAGLLVLTRPEGVLLIGLTAPGALWTLVRRGVSPGRVLAAGLAALAPLLVVLAPYVLLNQSLGGRPWPNTFYAKQAEYAGLLARPLVARLAQVALPPFTGAQVLLLPGLAAVVWVLGTSRGRAVERLPRPGLALIVLLYLVAHLGLYAARLPVTYQHGRYLMPAIPLIVLLGACGLAGWFRPGGSSRWRRVMGRTWWLATAILVAGFLILGAQAFARDVQVIQSEMVRVARWLNDHVEPAAWVAAHDIGALGYLAGRPILDLAGLLSPEVVPLLGDEAALSAYILDSPARYLVTAPGWPYRRLTDRPDVALLFSAGSDWTAAAGLNASAVYRLPER